MKMQTIVQNLSLKKYLPGLSGFLKRKLKFLLFLFFILSMMLWTWIFWQNVYMAVFSEPEVRESKFIKIKKAEAKAIEQDLDNRKILLEQIKSKSFKDPFVEKQIPIDIVTSQTDTTSSMPITP